MHRSKILFSVSLLFCFSTWAPDANMDRIEIIFGKELAAYLTLKQSPNDAYRDNNNHEQLVPRQKKIKR